jgi:Arc/MetJ-type ribon-helix-helix transcriptional regulator
MRYVSKEQIRYGLRKLNKKIQENPNRNKEKNPEKQKEASHNKNRSKTLKNSRR